MNLVRSVHQGLFWSRVLLETRVQFKEIWYPFVLTWSSGLMTLLHMAQLLVLSGSDVYAADTLQLIYKVKHTVCQMYSSFQSDYQLEYELSWWMLVHSLRLGTSFSIKILLPENNQIRYKAHMQWLISPVTAHMHFSITSVHVGMYRLACILVVIISERATYWSTQ